MEKVVKLVGQESEENGQCQKVVFYDEIWKSISTKMVFAIFALVLVCGPFWGKHFEELFPLLFGHFQMSEWGMTDIQKKIGTFVSFPSFDPQGQLRRVLGEYSQGGIQEESKQFMLWLLVR